MTLVTAPPLSVLGSGWIEPSSRPAAAERIIVWVSVSFILVEKVRVPVVFGGQPIMASNLDPILGKLVMERVAADARGASTVPKPRRADLAQAEYRHRQPALSASRASSTEEVGSRS